MDIQICMKSSSLHNFTTIITTGSPDTSCLKKCKELLEAFSPVTRDYALMIAYCILQQIPWPMLGSESHLAPA